MKHWIAAAISCAALTAAAQPATPPPTAGTLVLMTGSAEIELANDEAVANFFHETQDADLAKAQSQVNQRVGEGTAALKRADPKAQIETSGYGSYPVYSSGNRNIVGWRVRQGVTLKTGNLADLPKTVATAQSMLSLGGIDFRLSKAAREAVESKLIQQAIANLKARIASAAQALGVSPDRVRLEEVNFGAREGGPIPLGAPRVAMMASDAVSTPTFEAGRSIERIAVTGKARLLP
jgi:predicted secreted protein